MPANSEDIKNLLADEDRTDLHAYMGGILKGLGCMPVEINSEPDHAHMLFMLGRSVAVSEVVAGLKKSATDWLRARSPQYAGFHWQSGYGVFSVGRSAVETVQNYIRNQREHHRGKSFMDEYRTMLGGARMSPTPRHGITRTFPTSRHAMPRMSPTSRYGIITAILP